VKRLLLGVLLGALSALALVGCSSTPPSQDAPSPSATAAVTTDAAPTFTMGGAFDQITVADAPLMADGDTCTGAGGYADVMVGLPVYVFDPNGKLLATGAVGSSRYGFVQHASSCRLQFSVAAVPDGLPSYGVELGHEGVRAVSSIEAHGSVEWSAGP
jgi:hypothetical protein